MIKSLFLSSIVLIAFCSHASSKCIYSERGKRCSSYALSGDVFCLKHKKEIRASTEREIAKEKRYEAEMRDAAKAMVESQVQIMAEGMARAMGRVPCSTPRCKNYVQQGESCCEMCKRVDTNRKVERVFNEMEAAEYARKVNEARAKATLQRCCAKNLDGTICGLKTFAGTKYCSRHRPVVVAESPIEETKKRMKNIEHWIEIFKSKNGRLPKSLTEVKVMSSSAPSCIDAWGVQFYYECDGGDYALLSYGSDRKFDTSDDIVIIRRSSEDD